MFAISLNEHISQGTFFAPVYRLNMNHFVVVLTIHVLYISYVHSICILLTAQLEFKKADVFQTILYMRAQFFKASLA